MIKFIKNPCNLYMLLLTFYSMQGVMIPTGGTIISQMILLITMLMGLYYTALTIMLRGKPIYFKGLNMLFFILVIYGIILLFSNHHYVIEAKLFDNEVSNSSYLKSLFLSFPNIYVFYYCSRKNYLTEESLKKWIIIFFFVAIFRFIDYKMENIQTMLFNGKDVGEITNNMGYLFAMLIPSVAVFKDKIRLQYLLLMVCMVFLIIGMKRGAILVGVISLIYFLYYNYKYNKNISKVQMLFFSIVVLVVGSLTIEYMMDTSDYFVERMAGTKEGNASGRDLIYDHFWNHFKNEPDMLKFLLGNGANATLDIGVNYAHNDWLELAINQGVLGLVVYFIYWLYFIRTIRVTKYNKTAKVVLTLTFISFFIKALYSMSYAEYSVTASCAFGYYLAHSRDVESA